MFDDSFVQWHNQKFRLYKILTIVLLFLVFIAPPFVVFIGTLINNNGPDFKGSTSQWVAVLLIMTFVVLYFWRYLTGSVLKNSLWSEYAKVSGFKQSDDPRSWTMPPGGPVVSDGVLIKNSKFSMSGVIGKHKVMIASTGYRFNLFNSDYISLGNLSRYSFRYLTLAVEIGRPLPHIFIDGLSQNKFRYGSANMWSLSRRVSPRQRLIDLEGDFYKYFKVYIAGVDQPEIAALSIITPDVMLAVRDKGYDFDYEIYDGKLYVIAEDKIMSVDQMMNFFDAARAVTDELVPQLTKQLHADASQKLEIDHNKAGWQAAWYSLGIFMFYAVLYFFMIALCTSIAEYFSIKPNII